MGLCVILRTASRPVERATRRTVLTFTAGAANVELRNRWGDTLLGCNAHNNLSGRTQNMAPSLTPLG